MAKEFLDYKIPIGLFKKTTKFIKGHVSARMWMREILKWLNIPYYDCSCPTDNAGIDPVRFNESNSSIERFNGTAWVNAVVPPTPVTVTQITSKTTAVTANGVKGVITTVALTDAAGAYFEFTLNNSSITTSSVISLTGVLSGTGQLALSVTSIAAGSAVIRVGNVDNSEVFNSLVRIHFKID